MRTKLAMLMLVVLGVMANREAQAFYNPSTGRWLSRDPIGERGFQITAVKLRSPKKMELPLHAFVANDSVNRLDYRGLKSEQSSGSAVHCADPCKWARDQAPQDHPTASGTTVCCNGKKYGCVLKPGGSIGATDPLVQDILSACTQAHENSHVNNPDTVCPKRRCGWTGPQYAEPSDSGNSAGQRANECEAWKTSVRCLNAALAICIDPDVCFAITAELAIAEKAARGWCN